MADVLQASSSRKRKRQGLQGVGVKGLEAWTLDSCGSRPIRCFARLAEVMTRK